ncbi:MAG: hypothetical protein ABIJ09_22160 [Pseudomonadota bacterium]
MRVPHSTIPALFSLLFLVACPEPVTDPCGDGVAGDDEVCDGSDFAGATCATEGFSYGDLACTTKCRLDTSACVDDPCWSYPCAPYGTSSGKVIENLERLASNDAARTLAGEDGVLALAELYQQNEAHGGSLRGAMIFVTTGWCPFCAEEADTLEALYQANKDSGILLIGMVTENNSGRRATPEFAQGYAETHHWTFPTLAGDFPIDLWLPDDAGAVPMHVFVDLRTMRITGRFTGVGHPKLLQIALTELVEGPHYGPDFSREPDFDCAPGVGTEHEPNTSLTPEDGTTQPFALSGTLCPPLVAEGMLLDEDVVDLGQLSAGAVVDVQMESGTGSPAYPFFQVLRLNSTGTQATWTQMGPARLSAGRIRRQFIAEEAGRHVVVAVEGHAMAGLFYGDSQPPPAHSCCEGGDAYTYDLSVSSTAIAAGEPALAVDQTRGDAIDPESLRVYPLALTTGQRVAIGMTSGNASELDPYLVLLDSQNGQVLAFNDDKDYDNQNYNSEIVWTATADQTVWVVASYFSALFRATAPSYSIQVSTVP